MVAGVKHDVTRLEVAVNDLVLPQVFESDNNLSGHVLSQHVVEASLPLEEVKEATLGAVLHKQVQLVLIFKRLVELYNGRVVQIGQDASLDKDLFEAALIDEFVNQHLLQGELLWLRLGIWNVLVLKLWALELHLDDSAVGSITNLSACSKVTSRQGPHSIQGTALSIVGCCLHGGCCLYRRFCFNFRKHVPDSILCQRLSQVLLLE